MKSSLFFLARIIFLLMCFCAPVLHYSLEMSIDGLIDKVFSFSYLVFAFLHNIVFTLIVLFFRYDFSLQSKSPAWFMESLLFGTEGEKRFSLRGAGAVAESLLLLSMILMCMPYLWCVAYIERKIHELLTWFMDGFRSFIKDLEALTKQ